MTYPDILHLLKDTVIGLRASMGLLSTVLLVRVLFHWPQPEEGLAAPSTAIYPNMSLRRFVWVLLFSGLSLMSVMHIAALEYGPSHLAVFRGLLVVLALLGINIAMVVANMRLSKLSGCPPWVNRSMPSVVVIFVILAVLYPG